MKKMVNIILLGLFLFHHSISAEPQNIIERYQQLVKQNKWKEALPLIEEIVQRNRKIATSWFNLGNNYEKLRLHKKATKAFKKAYKLEPTDSGIQYRVFQSYRLARNFKGFMRFSRKEIKRAPGGVLMLMIKPGFKHFTDREEFKSLMVKHLLKNK